MKIMITINLTLEEAAAIIIDAIIDGARGPDEWFPATRDEALEVLQERAQTDPDSYPEEDDDENADVYAFLRREFPEFREEEE